MLPPLFVCEAEFVGWSFFSEFLECCVHTRQVSVHVIKYHAYTASYLWQTTCIGHGLVVHAFATQIEYQCQQPFQYHEMYQYQCGLRLFFGEHSIYSSVCLFVHCICAYAPPV